MNRMASRTPRFKAVWFMTIGTRMDAKLYTVSVPGTGTSSWSRQELVGTWTRPLLGNEVRRGA